MRAEQHHTEAFRRSYLVLGRSFTVTHIFASEETAAASGAPWGNPWESPPYQPGDHTPLASTPPPRKVLVLGSEGMLGPDVARALTDPASDFDLELLRLTDVVASPHLRDEAQVERTEASAAGDRGGGTAAIPASLPAAFQREGGGGGGEQGVVEYQEVDIAEAEAVEQATQGTDATVVSTLHPSPPSPHSLQPRVTLRSARSSESIGRRPST